MSDEKIQKIIAGKIKDNDLPCAVAFEVADQLGISPAVVGEYADANKLHLIKCQLGLFGYQPEKKIVKAADAVTPELEAAIKAELVNDRLPCKSVWMLAEKFEIRKMAISGACEALEIKIKPCQLGAF